MQLIDYKKYKCPICKKMVSRNTYEAMGETWTDETVVVKKTHIGKMPLTITKPHTHK